MKEITFEEILQKARKYNYENKDWHFHFLTPKCIFNDKGKFVVILENSTDGEKFITLFDSKPTDLERLEAIFYRRE